MSTHTLLHSSVQSCFFPSCDSAFPNRAFLAPAFKGHLYISGPSTATLPQACDLSSGLDTHLRYPSLFLFNCNGWYMVDDV